MESTRLLAVAGVTVWLALGVAAFAAAGKILRWDWTPSGLRRHYEDLAESDPRIARKLEAARLMRLVFTVLWLLLLIIWPLQIMCAAFVEHRWLGQGPRKTT